MLEVLGRELELVDEIGDDLDEGLGVEGEVWLVLEVGGVLLLDADGLDGEPGFEGGVGVAVGEELLLAVLEEVEDVYLDLEEVVLDLVLGLLLGEQPAEGVVAVFVFQAVLVLLDDGFHLGVAEFHSLTVKS